MTLNTYPSAQHALCSVCPVLSMPCAQRALLLSVPSAQCASLDSLYLSQNATVSLPFCGAWWGGCAMNEQTGEPQESEAMDM